MFQKTNGRYGHDALPRINARMDIMEELSRCKTAIARARWTIEKSMLPLTVMYGGEIESPTGRTYDAVEAATGVPWEVKSFSADETLTVHASFDGESHELPASNFYAEELVEVMLSMIRERNEALLCEATVFVSQ